MASLNWEIPVNSLLHRLQQAGYKLFSINDGEENIIINENKNNLAARKEAVEIITSVDYSAVVVVKNKKTFGLHIVLGNDPDEIVQDYTADEELEAVIDAFSEQWAEKKCPTI